jgi:hypothetical protein
MPVPALIVEDGSGVSGANSYASLATIKTFALSRGYDLSKLDNAQLTAYSFLAIDYLENFREKFKGIKATQAQALQWPRMIDLDEAVWSEFSSDNTAVNVQIDGFDILPNQIPIQLVNAQCQLIMEQVNGTTLSPTNQASELYVRVKQIGPLRTEYFAPANAPSMPMVDAFMWPLLSDAGAYIRTVRV